jgi:hypothetical protein
VSGEAADLASAAIRRRDEALVAVVQVGDEDDLVAEVTYRQSTASDAAGREIVICEVCVTTIDTKTGIRKQICTPIKCPDKKPAPEKPPETIRI